MLAESQTVRRLQSSPPVLQRLDVAAHESIPRPCRLQLHLKLQAVSSSLCLLPGTEQHIVDEARVANPCGNSDQRSSADATDRLQRLEIGNLRVVEAKVLGRRK